MAVGRRVVCFALLIGACEEGAVIPPPATHDACPSGLAECDGDPHTVCETPLDAAEHCGSCSNACPSGDPTRGEAAACENGVCEIVCGPGYDDCNGDRSDGCEADTQTDPDHCGSCEGACAEGVECEFGICTCEMLLSDLPHRPFAIAVDPEPEGFVYWSLRGSATNGGIQRAPKAGGPAVTIVAGQGPVEAIAIWGDQLYWYTTDARKTTGAIRSVAKTSEAATTWNELASGFAPNQKQASILAADADYLFWTATAGNDAHLVRAKRDGSEPHVVLVSVAGSPDPTQEVGDITLEGGWVYFTLPWSDAVMSVAANADAGTTPDERASAQTGVVGIDVHDTLAYWCNADELMQLDLGTNVVQPIASGFDTPELPLYVAADGVAAYFTSEGSPQYGSVLQAVRLASGFVKTMAAAQPGVVDLALDDAYVYFTVQGTLGPSGWSGGRVNRCPKLR